MGATLLGDSGSSCLRNDSRNLVQEWLDEKAQKGFSAKYVTNTKQLRQLKPEDDDFIMGKYWLECYV